MKVVLIMPLSRTLADRMHWVLSAGACGQQKLCFNKIFQFLIRRVLTNTVYNNNNNNDRLAAFDPGQPR